MRVVLQLTYAPPPPPPVYTAVCCLPCDRSAAHSAQWQDLEPIFRRPSQHGNRCVRRERVAFVSLRPAETFMRAYYDTHRSCMLPVFKGMYDTHTQLASVSYRHAKRCVHCVHICKYWLAYFSYTETVTRLRVLHKDEICWMSSLNDCSKIKGH